MTSEVTTRKKFRDQGRRICLFETDDTNLESEEFSFNARKCKHRIPMAVKFTDIDFDGLEFAECKHPLNGNRLTYFCPEAIKLLEKLPC